MGNELENLPHHHQQHQLHHHHHHQKHRREGRSRKRKWQQSLLRNHHNRQQRQAFGKSCSLEPSFFIQTEMGDYRFVEGGDLQVDSLFSFQVSQLKYFLDSAGIDYRDCYEKRELVSRLNSAQQNLSPHLRNELAQYLEVCRR